MIYWLILTVTGATFESCEQELLGFQTTAKGAEPCGSEMQEWCGKKGEAATMTVKFPETQTVRKIEFTGHFKMRFGKFQWYKRLNEIGNSWSILNSTGGPVTLDTDVTAD